MEIRWLLVDHVRAFVVEFECQDTTLEQWEGGLDGIVGWEEWKSLVATFERALMWLPRVRTVYNFLGTKAHPTFRCLGYGYSISLFSITHSAHRKYRTLTHVGRMTVH